MRSDDRALWRARPVLGAMMRTAILAAPAAASLAATFSVSRLLPVPETGGARVAWFAALLALGVGAAWAVAGVARRCLPLVTLLKLAMLFPDRAPSRFAVARTAGNVDRLRRRMKELERDPGRALERDSAATILALAVALRGHDPRTRGHSERVRVFTDMLAEEMGLPEDDRYRLRWAALLHDIGKLEVRPAILNKPGKLDQSEWEIIRTHPERGVRLAASLMEWLGPWGETILHHHERFDGSGYPAGLDGARISLGGRIVTLADAYDVMTAARSYKKPMATRAAREELARCAGTQFDPEVVRAFFEISLPRLLWRTGAASFLVQIPFLGWIRRATARPVVLATQTAAAAAIVAAVTVSVVSAAPRGGTASTRGGRPGDAAAVRVGTPTGAPVSPAASPGAGVPQGTKRSSRSPSPASSSSPAASGSTLPASVTQSIKQVTDTVNQVTGTVSQVTGSLPAPTPLPSIPPLNP